MARDISRRRVLRLSLVGAGGLAGCVGTPADEADNDMSGPEKVRYTASGPTPTEVTATTDLCQSNWERTDTPGTLETSFDSRERYKCAGEPLDNMEDLSGWEVDTGTLRADMQTYFTGSQSARLEADPSQKKARIYRTFEDRLDLSDRDISLAVKPGVGETRAQNVRLLVLAPDADNRVDMWRHNGKLNGWFRCDMGVTKAIGEPDLTDVTEIRLGTWTGGGRRVRFFVDDIRLTPKADTGTVILSFDDNHISQYETAFPRLRSHGYEGVVAAIPANTDKSDGVSVEQLQTLQDAGWDIISHPQTGTQLPELSRDAQKEALVTTKQWLLDNGFDDGSNFITYPYGAAGPQTFQLASKYHSIGFAGGGSPSGLAITDPLSISRVNGDRLERARNIVTLASKYNQLVVLMYHTIGGGGGRITTAEFEAFLSFLDDTDVDVSTASDLWNDRLSP